MVETATLEEVHERLEGESRAHRAFFIPILRAIAAAGGKARKRDVVAKIRAILEDSLNEKQLDYLETNNRFGWSRAPLKRNGLVGGEYGFWELLPLGRAYLETYGDQATELPLNIPEADAPARSTVTTESVPVTAFRGYEVPLLRVMGTGVTEKKLIMARLLEEVGESLLPGDKRVMPGGTPVWKFRAHWALSSLAKGGHAENIGTGEWSITSAGRERLEQEGATWDIAQYRNSQAKVRVPPGPKTLPPPPPPPLLGWKELESRVSRALFHQLDARLRPALGSSPDTPLARNIILYGPPGTGKTYLAKVVAQALTGEDEVSEDGHFRLVQFHPSYAYEDFVQGLRPDIKQTQLRYQLQKGPFLRIAEAAQQEPDSFFVLVIDEINRGDPARIFGELLYALEYRDEAVTLPLGGELLVPSNLVIIGTMNSVDRSVALVDYALRRRFGFLRVEPEPDVIAEVRRSGLLAEIGPAVLEKFNGWIRKRLGREHVLGHSFFISSLVPDHSADAFDQIWHLDVRPLLEEYFFGDDDGLAEASSQWTDIVTSELREREEVAAEEEPDAGATGAP
jgi:5-methylcytosine-specific restriction enzyme B